jgi:hypothetical protein
MVSNRLQLGNLGRLKYSPKSLKMKGLLGSRPTAGHMTLDHGIKVRILASQPLPSALLEDSLVCPAPKKYQNWRNSFD